MGRVIPELGYSQEGDIVTVRITREDFEALLLCLGAAAVSGIDAPRHLVLRVANALNAGRPQSEWIPYTLPDKSEVQ